MDTKSTKMEFDSLLIVCVSRCAFEVHRILGPGLLDSNCEECLIPCFVLRLPRALRVLRGAIRSTGIPRYEV